MSNLNASGWSGQPNAGSGWASNADVGMGLNSS
jgi:hypothetical protein